MRLISLICTVLLTVSANASEAQVERAQWDLTGTVGLVGSHLGDRPSTYGDEGYSGVRYALGIGRYWTQHLKTEVECATSGEGSTYGFVPPNSVESLHRLDQVSTRMVWQFGENNWVHPYLSGGLVADRARSRIRIPARYEYPSGRSSGPMILTPESVSEPTWDHRIGFTVGAGAKLYVSQNAFFNAGVVHTYSKAAATLSLVAGFGIDF